MILLTFEFSISTAALIYRKKKDQKNVAENILCNKYESFGLTFLYYVATCTLSLVQTCNFYWLYYIDSAIVKAIAIQWMQYQASWSLSGDQIVLSILLFLNYQR